MAFPGAFLRTVLAECEPTPRPVKGETPRGPPALRVLQGVAILVFTVKNRRKSPFRACTTHVCEDEVRSAALADHLSSSLGVFLTQETPHDSGVTRKRMAIFRPPGDQKMVLGACQEILWPQAQGGFLFPSLLLILV